MTLDTIVVSDTAAEKTDRYLTATQLKRVLREETGYVCTQTSPNHDGLYADDEFVMRGEFDGQALDIVFAVEEDCVVVVTQMSQHDDSLRGHFYEYVGETASDAIEYAE